MSGGSSVSLKDSSLIPVKSENTCTLSEWSEIVDLSLDSEFPLMKVTRYHLLLGIFSYLIVCKILYLGLKMANKVCTRYV